MPLRREVTLRSKRRREKIYFRSERAFYYIRSDPLYRSSRRRSSPVARSASGSPAGAAVCVIMRVMVSVSHTTYDGDHIRRLTTFVRGPHVC